MCAAKDERFGNCCIWPFGVDSSGYIGNPNLKPERSTGWEAGLTVDVPALGRPDFATIGVTYFDNRIRDLITTVYNSTYTAATSANVSHARSTGVETSLTLANLTGQHVQRHSVTEVPLNTPVSAPPVTTAPKQQGRQDVPPDVPSAPPAGGSAGAPAKP